MLYDALYASKDYRAEAEFVVSQARAQNPKLSNILDLGCGTGRHALEWMQMGYEVTGVDISPEMVTEARTKGLTCHLSSIAELDLGQQFDLVVSLFHVFGYIRDNEELISSFRRVQEHLRPGGLFLFDAWYSPAVLRQRALPRVRWAGNGNGTVLRVADPVERPNENLVEVRYDYMQSTGEKFREQHVMRHFSIPEISLLASFTGFELWRTMELLTCREPSTDTWAICYVLKKPLPA